MDRRKADRLSKYTTAGSTAISVPLLLFVLSQVNSTSEMQESLMAMTTDIRHQQQIQATELTHVRQVLDAARQALTARVEAHAIELDDVRRDVADLRRLQTDPNARPDAWSASMDRARMEQYDQSIKRWVHDQFTADRARYDGAMLPPAPSDLASVAAAIIRLDPADPDAWTADGAPRIAALSGLLGRPIDAATRDEAWTLLQVGRRVRAGQ